MSYFKEIKSRLRGKFDQAQQKNTKIAPYYVVGNGVMTTRSSEVVRSTAFREQMDASAEVERHLSLK